jgi:ATP-dependent RNA helicase RhlE
MSLKQVVVYVRAAKIGKAKKNPNKNVPLRSKSRTNTFGTFMKFTELDLEDPVLDALEAMRFEECTPVQEHTIPPILEGRDLIGIAQTGTGKTAAYTLPILNRMLSDGHPEDAINCIIMAPTRELAQQIDQQMEGFSYFLPFSSVAVYGGNDGTRFEQEKRGLTLGADIVIATPGRLLAHIALGYVDLSRVSYFVLDEADRMLDMGFYDDIMQVVRLLPETRQTILFSATMPANIKKLTETILKDPVEVKLAISRPADKIKQSVTICYERQKLPMLQQIFGNGECPKTVLFSSSKQKVKEIARMLLKKGFRVGEMHSDLEQSQRDEVMRQYKNGHLDILVATDIVSRGIDIDDIELVVNYDVPHDAEDYVHRIGRTARADRDGASITFVGEDEQQKWAAIERFLGREVERNAVPAEFGETPEYNPRSGNRKGRGGRPGNRGKGGNAGASAHSQNRSRQNPRPQAPASGEASRSSRRSHGRRRNRGKTEEKNTGN